MIHWHAVSNLNLVESFFEHVNGTFWRRNSCLYTYITPNYTLRFFKIYFSITGFMLKPLLFCAMSKETSWRSTANNFEPHRFVNILDLSFNCYIWIFQVVFLDFLRVINIVERYDFDSVWFTVPVFLRFACWMLGNNPPNGGENGWFTGEKSPRRNQKNDAESFLHLSAGFRGRFPVLCRWVSPPASDIRWSNWLKERSRIPQAWTGCGT